MKKAITPEDLIKFFEESAAVRFVDTDTGKPALEVIAKHKLKMSAMTQKSDYDTWLDQQGEDLRREHEMGAL